MLFFDIEKKRAKAKLPLKRLLLIIRADVSRNERQ